MSSPFRATLAAFTGALALSGVAWAAPGAGLSAGALTLEATVPGGVELTDVTLGASNRLQLQDRTTLNGTGTSTGSQTTRVGNDATVWGDVISVPMVQVQHRAYVSGTVHSEGAVNVQASASVGAVLDNQTFGADVVTALDFTVPATTAGDLHLPPDTTDTWTAERHNAVTVNSRATLKISAGTYFVDRLTIEPQARIEVDDTAGPVVIVIGKSMIARGMWIDVSDNDAAPELLIASEQTQAISLETAFDGFIVAPYATLRITGNDLIHRGAFFARDILVTPSSIVDSRSLDVCSFVTCATPGVCADGFDTVSTAPSGDMVVCDDPTNTTCEQDLEDSCPTGWGLCTQLQHNNRNTGWNFPLGGGAAGTVVGEISCRSFGGAGHHSLGPYDGITNLNQDAPLNCGYGSSRPTCTATYGCNETAVRALCCAPDPSCGNGVVDSVEEQCDDGNTDETDDCLNSCSWRLPSAHGVSGIGCG